MKRIITSILLLLLFGLQVKSQSNEFEVGILSPIANQILDTNAKINVSIVLINKGPNVVNSNDKILFRIKIGSNDSTTFIDTSVFAGRLIRVDETVRYDLVDSFAFYGSNRYEVCASVQGTIAYPTNSSKKPGPCVGVLVGEKEIQNKINKVYFAEGRIRFELDQAIQNGTLQVLSITGQELLRKRTNNSKRQEFSFNPGAKGIYFLRVTESKGSTMINKFIVR